MKALILSVSAGGGHKHAALAVKNYIQEYEPFSEVIILDTIKYINPLLDKVIIGSYLKTIKITPMLFGKLYNFTENTEKDDGFKAFSNKLNEIMSAKILPAILNFNPDIIVCTHPFPTEMISILKHKGKLTMPMVCILTDHTPHNFWIHPYVDYYIVSNTDMKKEMNKRGVKSETIHDLGIPVNSSFLTKFSREETLMELGLNPNKKTLLIMGGSLGMGKIAHIYSEMSSSRADIQIIAITGNNKKLYSELSMRKKTSSVDTRILGFTKDVNKYMQCSDLLLTKPGGLTIAEALICNLPLALFSAIPGQEKKNEEFLLNHNIAISIGEGNNCRKIIEELISDSSKLTAMRRNCMKFSRPNCGKNIYNLLNLAINNKEVALTLNNKKNI